VIVHLAAVNRHPDPDEIYKTNIKLVRQLIESLEKTGSKPHVLFSSSTQEELDNPYGRSKKEGRELLADWSGKNGNIFTGLIFPNVFGPFGRPYYNSFIATFCHQLNHNEKPEIKEDKPVKLICVDNTVKTIIKCITDKVNEKTLNVPFEAEIKVAEVLEILEEYKEKYLNRYTIPEFNSKFEKDLFNTFRSYMDIDKHFPVKLISHPDKRGTFTEILKTGTGGQVSFSTTRPGICRGNHFHTRKIERFIVIKGKAEIKLRKIGAEKVFNFNLDGKEPAFVDMPIWYTHNITNTGEEDLYTLFWVNEFYDPNDPDTYYEKV